MPNWCENDLKISGPKEKIEECLEFIGEEFDFTKLIPYAEPYVSMDADFPEYSSDDFEEKLEAYKAKWNSEKDGFNSGGYEWCVANYGTKWSRGYNVVHYTHPLRGQCVSFETAWTPPTPVIKALAIKFPELTFTHEYFECGCGFCGGITFQNKEDFYEDEIWEPGIECEEWKSDYAGPRGG